MDTARFLEGDTVWPDIGFFDLKIRASILVDAVGRLHNQKFTKLQPWENCGLRAKCEIQAVDIIPVYDEQTGLSVEDYLIDPLFPFFAPKNEFLSI